MREGLRQTLESSNIDSKNTESTKGIAKIVNISSSAGSLRDSRFGFLHGKEGLPASGYGISKLALNGLTIKMAREPSGEGIQACAICPDVTDTRGLGFGRPVEVSAKGVVERIVDCNIDSVLDSRVRCLESNAKFYRDGEIIEW